MRNREANHFYWDTNALAKRYAPESGTPLVNHLFAQASLDRMMCLGVGTGEVLSVFVRKKNAGLITDVAFSQAMTDFRAEVTDSADFKLMVVADPPVFASHHLIERRSLNATDALVLRSALDIVTMLPQAGNDAVLLTSDLRLLQAVQAKGLKTFNLETDSQEQIDTLISVTS